MPRMAQRRGRSRVTQAGPRLPQRSPEDPIDLDAPSIGLTFSGCGSTGHNARIQPAVRPLRSGDVVHPRRQRYRWRPAHRKGASRSALPCGARPCPAPASQLPALIRETVQNLGVITPHFETDGVPTAPRRRNPC
jgi:hypothetical protein